VPSDTCTDDAVAAVEAVLDAEHVHRAALALGNAGGAAGQLGHDQLGVDAIGEHVAVVAIARDDAVLADGHRRLKADGDRFLTDIEVAKAADQPEAVKLTSALFEAADEQHLTIELEQFVLGRFVALGLSRTFPVGDGRCCGSSGFGLRGTRHVNPL
jgi:hypothetical protein